MENLDELAAFIFQEDTLSDEEVVDSLDSFSADDIELSEEIIQTSVELKPRASLASILIDNMEEPDEETQIEPITPAQTKQDFAEQDMIISLAQYNRYFKIEMERNKSNVKTKDIYIPSSNSIPMKNQSTSDVKQDNLYKFVEAYINNTGSTDSHLFRLWFTRKDAEFSQYDKNGLMKLALTKLTEQRNYLYSIHNNNTEKLDAIIVEFMATFTRVASSKNKIAERFKSSRDEELHKYVSEIDRIFDASNQYYSKSVVQRDDIYYLDEESKDKLDGYSLASSICVGDSNELKVICACGETINYKENIQLYQRKGTPFLKVRYPSCPICGKKIILHRNVIFALEQILLREKEQMGTLPNQTTVMFVGREELMEAHGYLSSNRTPQYILKQINPEVMATSQDIPIPFNEEEDFVESFLNILEIQTLKHMSTEIQKHVMQYLCNLNGMSTKLSSIVNFMHTACVPEEIKERAEVLRFNRRRSNEKRLQQTLKGLVKNKAFSNYLLSDANLGQAYLTKRITIPKALPDIPEAALKQLRDDIIAAIKDITFSDYVEFSAQKVDPTDLYLTGMGEFIENVLLESEINSWLFTKMFEAMIDHNMKQQKIEINLPIETRVPRDIANKISRVLKDIKNLKSFEEFNAATVFNILGIRMEDMMLSASNECKRLNRRTFNSFIPPIDITLPNKFGTYLLYLSIIRSTHDLKQSYLKIREDAVNPWDNNMEKTILLYALLTTFQDETANPADCKDIIYFLKESGEQLCLD